jgi:hypothetical protein
MRRGVSRIQMFSKNVKNVGRRCVVISALRSTSR